MSARFTPGPWSWETPLGEHCPWIVKAGQEAYEWEPIATLGDCTEDRPAPRSAAFAEVQANARLIAAAPDLYEKGSKLREAQKAYLQKSRMDLRGVLAPKEERDRLGRQVAEAAAELDAALAKARGDQ